MPAAASVDVEEKEDPEPTAAALSPVWPAAVVAEINNGPTKVVVAVRLVCMYRQKEFRV